MSKTKILVPKKKGLVLRALDHSPQNCFLRTSADMTKIISAMVLKFCRPKFLTVMFHIPSEHRTIWGKRRFEELLPNIGVSKVRDCQRSGQELRTPDVPDVPETMTVVPFRQGSSLCPESLPHRHPPCPGPTPLTTPPSSTLKDQCMVPSIPETLEFLFLSQTL